MYGLPWYDHYSIFGLISSFAFVFFNQMVGVYTGWRGRSLFAGYQRIIKSWMATWLFLIILAFLIKVSDQYSRFILTVWAITVPVTVLIFRFLLRLILARFRSSIMKPKRVAILGAGILGQRFAKTLIKNKLFGYSPTAFFDDDSDKVGQVLSNVPVVNTIDKLLHDKALLSEYDEISIALPLRAEERIKEILDALADTSLTVKFLPDFFSFDLLHSQLSDIGGITVISVYDSPLNNAGYAALKRLEDVTLSIIILSLVSPLMLLLAIGVKITSPGPVFYIQRRISWNGQHFNMLKFRSMPVNIEENEVKWGNANTKTTSRFGQFMRRTSLDELPQFLNVINGDMSIVGPRPERDMFVEQFRNEIPRYMQKHLVKAGITGWAQINGLRGDTDLLKRIEYDLHYIDNWSIWFDIKIIILTILKGFISKDAY
jgi:putative colanic acid biosynthesis UDP-glucose lipid carrier transferase